MATNKVQMHAGSPCHGCNGIGDAWRQMDAAGIKFPVYSVEGAGLIVEASQFQYADPLIYRTLATDVAWYDLPPNEAAAHTWSILMERVPPEIKALKDRVWIEIGNEQNKQKADWLGWYYVELAGYAMANGYRICGPGWSTGEPEPEDWQTPGWLAYLHLCAANPSRLAVTLHEYSLSADDVMDGYPWLVGRFQFLFDTCDAHGIARPVVFITEAGWTHNDLPHADKAKADIDRLARLYAEHPTIKAAFLWSIIGGGDKKTLAAELNALMPWLTEYTITTTFPDVEPPPPPVVEPPPTEIPMSNQLFNPSFDGGWTDDNTYPATQQNPNHWTLLWNLDAVSERSGSKFLLGEAVHKSDFPDHELGVLKWDGPYSYKVFAAYRPIWARMKQTLNLPGGQYKLRTPVFVDCFHWKGYKDFALGDAEHAQTMVKVNDITVRDWTALKPGERNETETVIDHAGGVLELAVHFRAHWAIANNGFFLDGWSLMPVTVTPPPPPTEPPVKHKAIVVKLPQDISGDEVAAAVSYITPKRRTLTFSHDDLRRLLTGGDATSYAEIAYPSRQQDVIDMVEDLGYAWIVPDGFEDEPVPLIADTFRAPVGTAEERERGDLWN